MYTAGGASTNIATAYKDFWYLFSDTYPPASPYPSKEGTRGGSPSVASGIRTFGICFWIHTPRLRRTPLKGDARWRCVGRHVVEYGKICDYGTSKKT